jgi:hypothetical protein
MYDLKLNFSDGGVSIIDNEIVEGFYAVAQNALLNLATEIGTDQLHPERGTRLERQALKTSNILSLQAGGHIANLAASDTLDYIKDTQDANENNGLVDLDLEPVSLQNRVLKLNAVATGARGDVIGVATGL